MGSDDSDESLDPVDWDSFRALAHAVLDDAVDYVRTIRELNIVCFRFRPADWDEPAVDLLNEDVIVALQESGVAVPSATRIRGHLAIRANLTNHRTRREDLDLFARSAAEEAARRIAAR